MCKRMMKCVLLLVLLTLGFRPCFAGEKILLQSSFEADEDLSGWGVWNCDANVVSELLGANVPDVPAMGDSCVQLYHEVAGGASWEAQYGRPVDAKAGYDYVLSAYFKAQTGTAELDFSLELGQDPWTRVINERVTADEEWQLVTVSSGILAEDLIPGKVNMHVGLLQGTLWVDAVELKMVKSDNLVQGGDFSDASAWTIIEHTIPAVTTIDAAYMDDAPLLGEAPCLRIATSGNSESRPIVYQKLSLIAGRQYMVDAAMKIVGADPVTPAGFWTQLYMSPEEPDPVPEATIDWNPPYKLFDLNAWQSGFEAFVGSDALFSELSQGQQISDGSGLYVPPGEAGTEVDIFLVIKPGQCCREGNYEILFDNVSVIEIPLMVETMDSIEATGSDGELIALDGIDVNDLVLATMTTDYEKWSDHPAVDGENFSLASYASLDDANEITITFDQPVQAIFIIERNGNDKGFLQALDAEGIPFGALTYFMESDWLKTAYSIDGGQVAAGIRVLADRPMYGVRVTPDGTMGLDPVSVSGLPLPTENLVQGGDFSDASAWTLIEHTVPAVTTMDPAYMDDAPALGEAPCLRLVTSGNSEARPIVYQKLTLIAGTDYMVDAAFKILDATPTSPSGTWIQIYMSPEEPDPVPEATIDWNPPYKLFDINAWNAGFDALVGSDGLFSELNQGQQIGDGTGLYTPPGEAGTEVDIFLVIKPGQCCREGSFDLLFDNVSVTPL